MRRAWGDKECIQYVIWESQKERDNYEELDVRGE
jgi:hypothetical protein